MEQPGKYILLVRGNESEDFESFRNRIEELSETWKKDDNVTALKICLTLELPPALSVIPFQKKKIAAISIYTNSGVGLHFPEEIKEAYLVEEALPVSYQKTWNDNELTPGICLLTLFNKKRSIDHNTFLDRWHNGHTPLSLRIHPLWHYSRNVVKERVGKGAGFDGIVDEHFRERKDLLNPFLFFGPPHKIIQRMINVYMDVRSFLDYGSIESYLTREIHLKSE